MREADPQGKAGDALMDLVDKCFTEPHEPEKYQKRLTRRITVAYNPVRTRGCSSVVERLLPKQDIVGSSPITRSRNEWIGHKMTIHSFLILI